MYVHIPFCRAKCSYCDFGSYPGMEALYGAYTGALIGEVEQAGRLRLRTIYFGGGTPTVLPLFFLSRIVEAIGSCLDLAGLEEMTIEANPGTVDGAMLASLRRLGFGRLSLGVQSLDAGELSMLGRIHGPAEAAESVHAARAAGFEQVNLDLIFGLPGQATATWKASLEGALALEPDHLSLYALTLEEGTPLAAAVAGERLPEPDPDVAAEMYELAERLLAAEGFGHYEISNWARTEAAQCRHNLGYWRNEPYRGVGAGAHSWQDGLRRANVASPTEYVARLAAGRQAVEHEETIDAELEMGETMMLGLRLLHEGVSYDRFRERFGAELGARFGREIEELVGRGLLVADAERVRLSERGRLLGNLVFMQFLPG